MKSWLEDVPLSKLKEHPRNYRTHPEDQLAHIEARIRKYGVYRDVLVARDYTILAGHGVVRGAQRIPELETVQVRVYDCDPNSVEAIEILTGDNEVGRLGEVDDRKLTVLLKDIKEDEEGSLLGTGHDEQTLANLIFVTRPKSEIEDEDAAAAWVGLPEYEPTGHVLKVVVNCESEGDRNAFLQKLGVKSISKTTHGTLSIWWPLRERESVTPVRFKEGSSASDGRG